MNCRTKAMTISLLLHGTALSLIFALSNSLARQDKPIVIDFTIVEPSAPPAPPAPVPQKKTETPVIAKTRPQPTTPKQKVTPPAPAVEPEGPVAIVAKPKEPIPPPAEQTAPATATNSVPGGTGTSVTSRTPGIGHGESEELLANRYRTENFVYIKKIIEGNLTYPRRAQRMGWTGRCVVSFVILVNGQVTDIRIQKSTGYDILDDNVIETIKKTAPFPRPPIKAALKIPITYQFE
ncbi:MAG: TonB family protein [Geobacteraceae bacterium]